MIYELMLYYPVIPTHLNVCVLGKGRDIKSMKTENIAHRNYHKSTVCKTLYIFIVNVQVNALFLY